MGAEYYDVYVYDCLVINAVVCLSYIFSNVVIVNNSPMRPANVSALVSEGRYKCFHTMKTRIRTDLTLFGYCR